MFSVLPICFITFTANPTWPEITNNLLPSQNTSDHISKTRQRLQVLISAYKCCNCCKPGNPRVQITSACSFLPIYNFEAWIIIFSLNCNCICELQWITMDYVNYNGPNCLHKFACIPHYFCELESISLIFHKYIFYNRYIINGFQPSQRLMLPVFSHSTARHFSTLCSRYLSKYGMRFSLAMSWFNIVRMYAHTGILMSTHLCEKEDLDNSTSSQTTLAQKFHTCMQWYWIEAAGSIER